MICVDHSDQMAIPKAAISQIGLGCLESFLATGELNFFFYTVQGPSL